MFGFKKLERRVKALILVALTGGLGIGGYTYRDHPIVRQLLGRAGEEAEAHGVDLTEVEAKAKDAIKKVVGEVSQAVEAKVDLDRPGTFEVTITAIRVDPAEFHAGRSADLDVRVIRHAPEGKDAVIWEGKATARPDGESRGSLELSWADRPFRVEWKPGVEYTIEVRDRKVLGLVESTWFALDLDDDGSFPLRSKTHPLDARADGKPTRDPSANAVVLKSRRVAPEPEDRDPSVAGREPARRPTRR